MSTFGDDIVSKRGWFLARRERRKQDLRNLGEKKAKRRDEPVGVELLNLRLELWADGEKRSLVRLHPAIATVRI